MKPKDLLAEVAKREGKKQGVSIAQIREIVGIVADLVVDDEDGSRYAIALFGLGLDRSAARKAK